MFAMSVAVSSAFAEGPNDHVIVPGQRIGPMSLNMSTADLYHAMGEPKNSVTANNGTWASYEWDGVMVWTDLPAGKVTAVLASAPQYSMKDGITIGSSELALRVNRPSPVWTKATTPATKEYCYDDGLNIGTTDGKVSFIKVWSPGCGKMSGNYVCFKFEGGVTHLLSQCERE